MDAEETITEAEISAVVDRFYAKVRRDPEIGPVFNNAIEDWPEHLALLKDFWSSVMLATGRYKGRPLRAHLPLPIGPKHFERWLQMFEETTRETMAAPLASMIAEKAQRIAESLNLGLFYSGTNAHHRAGM